MNARYDPQDGTLATSHLGNTLTKIISFISFVDFTSFAVPLDFFSQFLQPLTFCYQYLQ
jgi:hypothetical protein